MPGLNTTGAPNTRDYLLGRGRILLATLDAATGLPNADGFRDLGNSPEFNLTASAEDLRHQSSRECLKFTDARFTISQEVELSFTLDEINFQNLASFVSGTTSSYDNGHDSAWAAHEDSIVSSSVVLGRWYQLYDDDAGAPAHGTRRVYNLDATGCVYSFEEDPAGTPTALVEGTDFEIDEQLGLVRFLPTAVNVSDGDVVGWALTTAATTPQDLDQVNALKLAAVEGALLFISENAGECGQKVEFLFHKVSLTADGDAAMIGDELTTLSFNGVAEVNSQVTDESQVLTVRTYDMLA
jgi:hypothetical protein